METATSPPSPKSVTANTDLLIVEGSNNTRGKRTRGGLLFPWKLHDMLRISKSEGNDSIVSWLPAPYPHTSSNRFKVHNVSEFVSNILPLFFSNQTKFKSFQRQLNLWGFLRIQNGPEKGAYYHKYFLQDSPDLCRLLTRQKYASTTKQLFTSSIRTTYSVDSNNNNTNNKTNTTTTTTTTSVNNKEKKKLTNTRSQQRQRKMPFVLTTTSSGDDVVVVRNPQQQFPHRKVSIELSQESSINNVNDHQHNNDQHHLLEKFDDNCFDTLDLEEFEGFTFYHLEQEQCYRRRSKEEEELHNNNNRNDRLFFTPAMETHQIQQDTISLLKELDQQDNDNDDYGLPKMVFNITSLF